MAKKSTKKAAPKKVSKKTTTKSHGELFDKHQNLLWLLPIFFLVAVIAVYMINNMYSVQVSAPQPVVENTNVDLNNETINNDPITNESLQ